MGHEWCLRIRSHWDSPTRSRPTSVIGTGVFSAWILYFPASDVIEFFNTEVHKFRAPGYPGNRIWHRVAWYCVFSVCSFCTGVFGSQTDTISRYFATNRSFLRNEGVVAYKFSKNLGAVWQFWAWSRFRAERPQTLVDTTTRRRGSVQPYVTNSCPGHTEPFLYILEHDLYHWHVKYTPARCVWSRSLTLEPLVVHSCSSFCVFVL